MTQPNILFFIVDEQRYPPQYETDELKEWKTKNLVFQTLLAEKGAVFHQHYINTCACSPSRTTIHTGQYPNVHGLTQTDGLAKSADDPTVRWLEPYTVPTIGNYLSEAGYNCFLKGLWHVSNASIKLRDGTYLTTFDANGVPIPENVQFYLEKNVLKEFGYDGWIGPEAHGAAALNSGSSVKPPKLARDIKFAHQVVAELERLEKEQENCSPDQVKPWFLISSFVNPHDIAVYSLWARLSQLAGTGWFFPIDETLPKKLFKDEFNASNRESLDSKPAAQKSYRDLFQETIQPIIDQDRFQRFYYSVQKKVDADMLEVWKKLVESPMYKNTIVVFTSDHGELLTSHGGMIQKWYQAYQESIHVPLIISSPLFGNRHKDIYHLTSHIDLLPTFGEMAHRDLNHIRREKFVKRYSLAVPLFGKSLVPLIERCPETPKDKCRKGQAVYFYTQDDPTRGPDQISPICQPYRAVVQPGSVEAILTYIHGDLYKLTHYYDAYNTCNTGSNPIYELYNVTRDFMELDSLYDKKEYRKHQRFLMNLLNDYRVKFRTLIPVVSEILPRSENTCNKCENI